MIYNCIFVQGVSNIPFNPFIMRKLLFAIVTLFVMFTLASCGGSSNSPKTVAKKYVKAMVADECEKMVEYLYFSSPDVDKDTYLDFLKSTQSDIDDEYKILSMDYVSETILEDGLTADVTFWVERAVGEGYEFDLRMVKVEDQWFVDSGK